MASYKVENIESVDELLDNKTNEDVGIEPMIFAPDEPRVTINERILVIPDELKTIGVENDNNVERIYFEIPRYFDEVNDLSEFTIYINYLNANQEPNKYHCTDVEVEGENIVFSWLTSEHVYSYRGTVRFIVYAVASDNRKWNSTVAELFVMEGLETEEQIIDNNPDIIDELINMKPQVEEALQRIGEQQNVIDQQQDTIEEQQSTITEQQKDIEDTINNLNNKIENGDFTPEFTIGDVETVEPSVPAEVNQTGTQLDPILNFKIPRGATNVVDNLDGTSVAEAPSQRTVKEAIENVNTEIDQIKEQGVAVGDTLPINSIFYFEGDEDELPTGFEKVDIIPPRQLIINPDFQINARGQLSYTGNGYALDMWYFNATVSNPISQINKYGGILINKATSNQNVVRQYTNEIIENDVGKQYTLVVNIESDKAFTGTFGLGIQRQTINVEVGKKLYIHTFTLNANDINESGYVDILVLNADANVTNSPQIKVWYADLWEGPITYPHVKKTYREDLWDCMSYVQVYNLLSIRCVLANSNNGSFYLRHSLLKKLNGEATVITNTSFNIVESLTGEAVDISKENILFNIIDNSILRANFTSFANKGKDIMFDNLHVIISCEPIS